MADEKENHLKLLYDRYVPSGSRRRKLVYFIVIPVIALAILGLLVDAFVMPIITRHGSEFELPDIVEMLVGDAEELLKMKNLRLEVTSEEYHFDKPEGTVLSQYPLPGTMVKSGRRIRVVISSGQKNVVVPELSGISVRHARLRIEAADLILGDIAWTFADSLPERVVVFAYPASGREVQIGTPINLMVNRGSLTNITYMPQVVGLSLDEARAKIDDAGLVVALVKHITNENLLPGTVLEQSVEAATELEIGEEIDLVVSTTE